MSVSFTVRASCNRHLYIYVCFFHRPGVVQSSPLYIYIFFSHRAGIVQSSPVYTCLFLSPFRHRSIVAFIYMSVSLTVQASCNRRFIYMSFSFTVQASCNRRFIYMSFSFTVHASCNRRLYIRVCFSHRAGIVRPDFAPVTFPLN